ncbi:MAG: prepilin-type N-terminal cleavage/methylation domain-containing protein [Planctomycetes bacterium]|nr:prepilin-type N-terminal cleavage/methylation domain-containing protein [Planctomycetota bacterium]
MSQRSDFGLRISDCGLMDDFNPQSEIRNPQSTKHVAASLRDANSSFGETRPRGGLTLIELLVVIIILTTIVAAAIPILTPADDDRSKREASRGLNTFITGAQARAISLNRPVGIALKRLSQDTKRPEDRGVCLEVFYVEQPPPFCGFDPTSSAMVALDNGPTGGAGQVLIRFVTRAGLPDPLPGNTIRRGDVVEVSGTKYRLTDDEPNYIDPVTGFYSPNAGNPPGTLVAVPMNDTGQMLNVKYDNQGYEIGTPNAINVPFYTSPAPYKILRQAMPTSDEPYQLPEGTAIDLRASGVGYRDYFYWPGAHDNDEGVQIMFSPEGTVSRVAFSRIPNDAVPFDKTVVDNVYLLVGKRENVPPAAGSDLTLNSFDVNNATTQEQKDKIREPINWLNGTSRWVVIGSQSGRIATIENAFVDLLAVLNDPNPVIFATQSTEEMRARQILAAREFTREMAQMGGR